MCVEDRGLACCEDCHAGVGSVSLRLCVSCGHVGCAEGSPSDHAAEHYAETDHPIALLIGSQGNAGWSYPHRRAF